MSKKRICNKHGPFRGRKCKACEENSEQEFCLEHQLPITTHEQNPLYAGTCPKCVEMLKIALNDIWKCPNCNKFSLKFVNSTYTVHCIDPECAYRRDFYTKEDAIPKDPIEEADTDEKEDKLIDENPDKPEPKTPESDPDAWKE